MQENNMVNPLGMDLRFWADSLVIDFPNDNIPILQDEESWETWGNDLINTVTFNENSAPDTSTYDNWFSWAQEVYYTMSNYGY